MGTPVLIFSNHSHPTKVAEPPPSFLEFQSRNMKNKKTRKKKQENKKQERRKRKENTKKETRKLIDAPISRHPPPTPQPTSSSKPPAV